MLCSTCTSRGKKKFPYDAVNFSSGATDPLNMIKGVMTKYKSAPSARTGAGFSHPEVDALAEKILQAKSEAEWAPMVPKLHELVVREARNLFCCKRSQSARPFATRKRILCRHRVGSRTLPRLSSHRSEGRHGATADGSGRPGSASSPCRRYGLRKTTCRACSAWPVISRIARRACAESTNTQWNR